MCDLRSNNYFGCVIILICYGKHSRKAFPTNLILAVTTKRGTITITKLYSIPVEKVCTQNKKLSWQSGETRNGNYHQSICLDKLTKFWKETRIFFRIIAQNSTKRDLFFHIHWWSSPGFLAVNTSSNAITPSSPLPNIVWQGKCKISILEKIFEKDS